jgi:hypothetical protein
LRVWADAEGFSQDATTDDSGAFRISGVPPGALELYASTSRTMQGRRVEKTVDVPPDADELPVELVFEGESRLTGRVLREQRPVAGAYVWVTPEPRASGSVTSEAMTDSDGRYAAEGIPDGAYKVFVRAEGMRATRMAEVSGDTELDVIIGGARLSGTVVDEESGEPLDGVAVQADDGTLQRTLGLPGGRTDSLGAYEIVNLDPGDYRVTASRSGYTSKTLTVQVGEDGAAADLRLRKGRGLAIHAYDGITALPVHGVDVVAFGADGALAHHGAVPLDAEGRGEIGSLSNGTYAVRLYSVGYAPRALVVSVPGPPIEAPLTPGGRLEVRSETPASGRALDPSGGVYLSSAFFLDGVLNVAPPVTVWDHFTPGAYRFVAGERSWSFTVEEGKTTVLELK